jgi:hypothetical protein
LESSINSNTITTSERNRQLIDRFLQSIKSDVTRRNALDYIHIYMRYWHLYEEKKEGEWEEEEEENPLDSDIDYSTDQDITKGEVL